MTPKQRIKELNAKIKALKKEVQKEMHTALLEGLKELFEKYPEVKSLQFTAYTPYFNDGEECTYSCRAGDCEFNNYEEYGDDEDISELIDVAHRARKEIWKNGDYKPNPDYDPRMEKCVDEFHEFLGAIPDENWKEIVGDHVKVNITPDGIDTDDYEHD